MSIKIKFATSKHVIWDANMCSKFKVMPSLYAAKKHKPMLHDMLSFANRPPSL